MVQTVGDGEHNEVQILIRRRDNARTRARELALKRKHMEARVEQWLSTNKRLLLALPQKKEEIQQTLPEPS